ncbi:MAG: tetratricopeptide repeat protein [Pyrinomonadaceae bacterium]
MSRRHREAATLLAHAVSLDSSLTEARVLLATAFDLQGMRERAAYHYRDVIDRRQQANDQETALALNNRGYSLHLAGEHKAAQKLIARAVELDSSNSRFLNNLGIVNFRLNKHKEAVKAFAKAGGEAQAYVNLAILLEQDGRRQDALKYYARARQLDPSSEMVRRRMHDLDERANRDHAQLAVATRPRTVQPTTETVKQ